MGMPSDTESFAKKFAGIEFSSSFFFSFWVKNMDVWYNVR